MVHTDCSTAFCISRQGIININKGSSIFSFRKRSRFDKMAEHFEYNHIPAQMSSINHFRVKSVLCYRENIVVLHLTRNHNSQFGLLDVRVNKFLGVFGRQQIEFVNEQFQGAITPDKTRCLIRIPKPHHPQYVARPGGGRMNQQPEWGAFQLFELSSKKLLDEFEVGFGGSHFCFDPRFAGSRLAVTCFERNQDNSLSTVQLSTWSTLHTNQRVTDTRRLQDLYDLQDMTYTRDGSLIVASFLDHHCFCREKRSSRNYQPLNASIYVFNGETTETLHCIEYLRYTCVRHLCPVNYTPIFSYCGNRMAVIMNMQDLTSQHFVNVFKLPHVLNLQHMCRIVIRQNFAPDTLTELPLPAKLIKYLHFLPEFE